jgi:hypothetical protein
MKMYLVIATTGAGFLSTTSTMSALSAFFPSRRPPSTHSDLLSDLRFSLEVMPGSRKYVFTPTARAEILSKLYIAFMGQYPHLFLPSGTLQVPAHKLLSEYQASVAFAGAGKEDPLTPGRPCSHIFKKGESCYRCKCVAFESLNLIRKLTCCEETVHWTIVVFYVRGVFMPLIIQDTT